MPIKAVLFDMDGVLVDTMPMHRAVWQRFAAERGVAIDDAWLRPYDGQRASDVIRAILGPVLDDAEVADLAVAREHMFGQLLEQMEPQMIPGAVEAVRTIKSLGVACVLATSGVRANVDRVLDLLGLNGTFDAVLTATDVTRGKPEPDIYLLGARRAGFLPAECVVVEDALPGVAAGLAAGCQVVGVSSSQPGETLQRAGARWVIPDLGQLPDIIQSIGKC